MSTPKSAYVKRQTKYSEIVKLLSKQVNTFSRFRLISFGGGFGLSFYLYLSNFRLIGLFSLALTVLMFLWLVSKHERLKKELIINQTLREINTRSLKRLDGNWHDFMDTGIDFKDDKHPYASDLDIFGQGSLFQWINTGNTYFGRKHLYEVLTQPLTEPSKISEKQALVTELAQKLDWRQRFEAYGSLQAKSSQNPEVLIKWGNQSLPLYRTYWLKILTKVVPLLTLTLLVAASMKWMSYLIPILLLLFQFVFVTFYRATERNLALNTVSKFKQDLKTYEQMICWFETNAFAAPYLHNLKTSMKQKLPAYRQIEQLERLSDWIANRSNGIFLIINILTLWDFHFMFALERWKERSGSLLENWLKGIAELEALSSLAVIRHDYPEWAYPIISDDSVDLHYEGKAIGHPLIHNRVTNDFSISPPNQVLLITGSNMSGKSTFLRTTGINLVLAYAGAPVCAKQLSCSIFKVHTCMRVSDNLEQNISSFYAEILRIKEIVQRATKDKKVFFLLDEIFKGTNSVDRHAGAQLLIKRLIAEGSIGLVSTHDLELGAMEQRQGAKLKNYHFREYYINDEIKFDYLLRPGVSTTRNAMYLIKMAGIVK